LRRLPIHPAVAVTGIACLTVLAVAAEHYHPEEDSLLKMMVIGIISYILGVKMRKLGLT